MKWHQKKNPGPLFDSTVESTTTTTSGVAARISKGREIEIYGIPGVTTKVIKERQFSQGRVNKFIENLFDHKVARPGGQTRIKQGTVNKFIESSLRKLTRK